MSDTEDTEQIYLLLKAEAKQLLDDQNYEDSLKKYELLYSIRPSERIGKRITKLKTFLQNMGSSESDDDLDNMAVVAEGFKLCKSLYSKLYAYQKEGLCWMWKLHCKKKGGILADDMGLGKTVQVIAFLTGLFDAELIKTVLIVMPVSLIQNWEGEIEKWSPGMSYQIYHGPQKEGFLRKIQRRGGVLMTSYGTLVSSYEKLSQQGSKSFSWDYVILDEAHKIKNPTKTTKAAHEIQAKHRLALTGTPLANNLMELWAIFDFCQQGSLLGSAKTFRENYDTPIKRSQEKDATAGERRQGDKLAEALRNRIKEYFLRRTKEETICSKENVDPAKVKVLPKKNDFILWTFLTPKQIEIYEGFLNSDQVRQALRCTKRSPLVELNVLKKICDHPRLFSRRICAELDLDDADSEVLDDVTADLPSIDVDPNLLRTESGKMETLILLLENLKAEGHRTLVFSQSLRILNIINKILNEKKWNVMRLDGTVKMALRYERISEFQNNTKYSVFLLTTQVGGVGLTITAADRVVIYDPSWNPATDSQAVDRVYRIGQKRDVIVYRLITCGTMEEKIYRRQIFKDSVTKLATHKGGDKVQDAHRYFTNSELKELFVFDDPKYCKTQVQLEKLHAYARKTTPELDKHIQFLTSLSTSGHIYGISDHDLMFRKDLKSDDVSFSENVPGEDEHIKQKVELAHSRIVLESKQNEDLVKQTGKYETQYLSKNKPLPLVSDTFNLPNVSSVNKKGSPEQIRKKDLKSSNLSPILDIKKDFDQLTIEDFKYGTARNEVNSSMLESTKISSALSTKMSSALSTKISPTQSTDISPDDVTSFGEIISQLQSTKISSAPSAKTSAQSTEISSADVTFFGKIKQSNEEDELLAIPLKKQALSPIASHSTKDSSVNVFSNIIVTNINNSPHKEKDFEIESDNEEELINDNDIKTEVIEDSYVENSNLEDSLPEINFSSNLSRSFSNKNKKRLSICEMPLPAGLDSDDENITHLQLEMDDEDY